MADPRQLGVFIIMVAAKLNTMAVVQFAPDGGKTGDSLVIVFHHHVIAVQVKPATARDSDQLMLFVVMEALFVADIIADVAQAADALVIEHSIVINQFACVTDFPSVFRRVYQVALGIRAETAMSCRHIRKWHDIPGRRTPK
ncbi:hypothetical protein, partial [Photorhabdus sp. RM157S]|uniref:hypothetical protein n=1 Tax=Photorhabdus sp. RM157S TaxID=3342827 RepID=UPI0036DCB766